MLVVVPVAMSSTELAKYKHYSVVERKPFLTNSDQVSNPNK